MKQIYGIDISKEKFDVNFLDSCGKSRALIFKNNLKGITEFIENIPKEAILCAEYTGVYSDLLLFLANCMNIPLALSTGYEIKHSLGLLKGKSDKIDAQRIREYGERFYDKLKFAKYEIEELKELQELYALRTQLVKERKMLITQQKSKKHKPYNSIKANEISQIMMKNFDKAIEDLEMEITVVMVSKAELFNNYRLVKGIKGIGHITTCELIIKTGNFKEISTAKKAASYAGICPFPNSSGKMVKKSRVSKMADKELKSLLYMCSVAAVKSNPEYKLYYQRKKQEGKPYFLAMNNIANKLLRTIYGIVESRKEYMLGYSIIDPRNIKKVA
jgi:transposase